MNFDPLTVLLVGAVTVGLLIVVVKMSFKADKTNYGDTARTVVNTLGIVLVAAIALGFASFLIFGESMLDILRSVIS